MVGELLVKSDNKVLINDICIDKHSVIISFKVDNSEKIEIDSWLESKNKYNPKVLYIDTDNEKERIIIDTQELYSFIKNFPREAFKLSLATLSKRISYEFSTEFKEINTGDTSIITTKDFLFFIDTPKDKMLTHNQVNIQYKNKKKLESINKLPVDVLSIGSCFSRNIFKSDEYFNPTYKKYFNLKKTLFHNSFISIFSDAIDYNFSMVEDLITGDAGLYTAIEFEKNIDKLFKDNNFKLVVLDNYIDATSPIIKYGNNSFLTYNRYLAESIFKRLLSSCEIIYPGTKQHLELYRKSIIQFNDLLIKYDIENVVLIGGRQSKYKINEKSNNIDIWSDKMEWILNANKNWDAVDKVFLEEIPHAVYIDKRTTSWKSDVFSPILGGASPSHYQSAYYKELFHDIMCFLN